MPAPIAVSAAAVQEVREGEEASALVHAVGVQAAGGQLWRLRGVYGRAERVGVCAADGLARRRGVAAAKARARSFVRAGACVVKGPSPAAACRPLQFGNRDLCLSFSRGPSRAFECEVDSPAFAEGSRTVS